ncbi:MAG: hypothetical protein PWP27_661 [Clostridiales bacterium]|jgi:NADH:ubiquinone oxidoreductase subunit E|nr:hypothetical protein [Clostridiales bacterium]MDK2932851.1 hypothetical protein [Clostridiales bacterium]
MLTIDVCIGSACHLKGAYNVINKLMELIDKKNLGDKVSVKAAFCLGECTKAVSVRVDNDTVYSVNEKTLEDFFNEVIMERLGE